MDSKKKQDDSLHLDSVHKLSSIQSGESKKKDRSDKASIRVVKVESVTPHSAQDMVVLSPREIEFKKDTNPNFKINPAYIQQMLVWMQKNKSKRTQSLRQRSDSPTGINELKKKSWKVAFRTPQNQESHLGLSTKQAEMSPRQGSMRNPSTMKNLKHLLLNLSQDA